MNFLSTRSFESVCAGFGWASGRVVELQVGPARVTVRASAVAPGSAMTIVGADLAAVLAVRRRLHALDPAQPSSNRIAVRMDDVVGWHRSRRDYGQP